MSEVICIICEQPIAPVGLYTQGHNAQPVADGRCCTSCNFQVVIPKRFENWMKEEE